MGGSYEKTTTPVGGAKLRIHYNEDEDSVHVHDDKAGIKFVCRTAVWPATYSKLRADALKSNMGMAMDANQVELHATLAGRTVTLGLRSPITGLEEFDKFTAELGSNEDKAEDPETP